MVMRQVNTVTFEVGCVNGCTEGSKKSIEGNEEMEAAQVGVVQRGYITVIGSRSSKMPGGNFTEDIVVASEQAVEKDSQVVQSISGYLATLMEPVRSLTSREGQR
jgi:hypothetical protein